MKSFPKLKPGNILNFDATMIMSTVSVLFQMSERENEIDQLLKKVATLRYITLHSCIFVLHKDGLLCMSIDSWGERGMRKAVLGPHELFWSHGGASCSLYWCMYGRPAVSQFGHVQERWRDE